MSIRKVARVLVVDDEPEICRLLVDALGGEDVEVSAAASGREAIRLAGRRRPDVLVTDMLLGDCNGLEVIDRVREAVGDVPAVLITGYGDAATFGEASRRRPVEMMNKPLDLGRLRKVVEGELARQAAERRRRRRTRRLRKLTREVNRERKTVRHELDSTCADLATAYRDLSGQLTLQRSVIVYQRELLSASDDDDVFRTLFHTFVRRSGPVFGVAMVCNEDAELRIAGRFGVPEPDCTRFCKLLSRPVVSLALSEPRCLLLEPGEQDELFDPAIRRYLPGITLLSAPLMPTAGELIGLVTLYRKGEQPFTEADVQLAEIIATPTAVAIRRND